MDFSDTSRYSVQQSTGSEISQGHTTELLGAGVVLFGLVSGHTWIWIVGLVIVFMGMTRVSRNAAIQHDYDVAYAQSLQTPGVRQ